MVNGKPVKVSLSLIEGLAFNNIFSCPFLNTIKASIKTKNTSLVSGLLVEQFSMEMMVPKRSKETPKISEELPDSLPVSIQGKQENMEDIGSKSSRVELDKTVIHQHQILGQH